jgi:hypothetical protein
MPTEPFASQQIAHTLPQPQRQHKRQQQLLQPKTVSSMDISTVTATKLLLSIHQMFKTVVVSTIQTELLLTVMLVRPFTVALQPQTHKEHVEVYFNFYLFPISYMKKYNQRYLYRSILLQRKYCHRYGFIGILLQWCKHWFSN